MKNLMQIDSYNIPLDPNVNLTIISDCKAHIFKPKSHNEQNIYQFKNGLSEVEKCKIKKFFGLNI